jgi:hypothetical protein
VLHTYIYYMLFIFCKTTLEGASTDYSRHVMERAQLTLEQRAAGAQQGNRRGGRRRWRRCGDAGEGCTRERDCALCNACTVLVQVGQNSVCVVQIVGQPM